MSLSETFYQEIEKFLVDKNVPATRFGLLALNDREFVRRMRRGGSVTLRTYDRVKEFMNSYDKINA